MMEHGPSWLQACAYVALCHFMLLDHSASYKAALWGCWGRLRAFLWPVRTSLTGRLALDVDGVLRGVGL